ncbi:MAG: hypothetical protein K6F79_00450 [Saccharofermentans sp.]|nr:hypothetical protein [Saccharofermentans sp.]
MNKFKIRLALLSFVTTMFFRFGILFLAGVVLCIIGLRINVCLIAGAALLMFLFIVSIAQTVRTFSVLRTSEHPFMKDVYRAMNGKDPYTEIGKVIEDDVSGNENVAGGRLAAVFMKQSIGDSTSISRVVEVFDTFCTEKMPREELVYEYGPSKENDKEFVLCFTREYPVESGTNCQVFLAAVYYLDDENRNLSGVIRSTELESDFFEAIRDSEGYKYAEKYQFNDVRTGFSTFDNVKTE